MRRSWNQSIEYTRKYTDSKIGRPRTVDTVAQQKKLKSINKRKRNFNKLSFNEKMDLIDDLGLGSL